MKAHKLDNFTVKDYLQQEEETDRKWEYHDGGISALAGGTLNHGILCGNIFGELRNRLKNKKSTCKPYTSEIKIYIKKTNSYVYPDSMVICGEIETSEEEINSVTNPILIVEVLSKSSARYDRGDKFYIYRQLPSFKEYVIIEQKRYIVDVQYKSEGSDLWQITRYEGVDKIIKLQSIGIEISMKDLYLDVNLDLPE